MKTDQQHVNAHNKTVKKTKIMLLIFVGAVIIAGVAGVSFFMFFTDYTGSSDHQKGENHVVAHTGNYPITGTAGEHEWVDLGLPSGLKWATCNVGATKPEEFGDYFAWGETEIKDAYNNTNSLTYKVSLKTLEKDGVIDESGVLTKEHDAATVNWGEPWRMPTEEEFKELIDNCKWEFTPYNNVNGYLVTGPNQQTIFIVAAGLRRRGGLEEPGEFGDYWSSSDVPDLTGVACSLGYSSKSYGQRHYARYVGRTIRPVTE